MIMKCAAELFEIIQKKCELEPINTQGFDNLKIQGMKFDIKAYRAKGLGHISFMNAKGLFGLMQMDTIIVTPLEKDLPLFSYDRIKAFGTDTLIGELFDTVVNLESLDVVDELETLTAGYRDLPRRNPGKHWYDDIKLSGGMSYKGKKKISGAFDKLSKEYVMTFFNLPDIPVTDVAVKKQKTLNYVNDLLENGGPSTNVFINAIGKERTKKLFYQVLFGV